MQTLKKKDIKEFKAKAKPELDETELEETELDETEEIDEFVNGMGAGISGDEKNVNNSEIETSPQATTDQFAQKAIQPNRYLYNVNSVGALGGGAGGSLGETQDKKAKELAIALLEDLGNVDYNNNAVIDINEIGNMGVTHKLQNLVKTIKDLGMHKDVNKVDLILNYLNNELKPKV
jgi:hypothetical protein